MGELEKAGHTEPGLIIAGAGTGGHIFPGIAVAQEIKRRREDIRILFVTEKRAVAKSIIERYRFHHRFINVEGLMGKGLKRLPVAILKLISSMFQCAGIIRDFRPLFVLGTGGYSAGPVCVTSKLFGIRTGIHEQNYYPGLTNRVLGRFADIIFISFKESRRYFPGSKTVLSGNPVREEIVRINTKKDSEKRGFTILVTGGSQGSHAVNASVLDAMKILKAKKRLPNLIHQSGEKDFNWLKQEYLKNGIQVDLKPFIYDIGSAYRVSDLVICRSGALTVSELAILGKPSILVPLPSSAEDHQLKNALLMERHGAGRVLEQRDLDGNSLSSLIIELMEDEEKLQVMAQNAKRLGISDASSIIAEYIIEIIEQKHKGKYI